MNSYGKLLTLLFFQTLLSFSLTGQSSQEARVHFTMTEVNIKVEPGMDLGLAILGWSPTPSHGKRDGDRLQNERGQAGGCSIDKQPAHPDSGASSEDGNSCDKVV